MNKNNILKIRNKLDKLDNSLLKIIKKRTLLVDKVIRNKKFKKDIVDNKRSSLIWYSIDNNYLPVMIEQYRLDKLMFRATLKSFED